ncbi:MAG TPA: hypothetical protein VKH37_11955, partial [Ferruginibacter sp.]|nr:hypothetical protein [Ferruginibacter sp.]
MNNRLFDEHIKDRFSIYTPDVPAHIWENIVAARDKKRPAGFWYTLMRPGNIALLLLLMVAGGTGVWLALRNSGDNASSPDNSTTATATQNNP